MVLLIDPWSLLSAPLKSTNSFVPRVMIRHLFDGSNTVISKLEFTLVVPRDLGGLHECTRRKPFRRLKSVTRSTYFNLQNENESVIDERTLLASLFRKASSFKSETFAAF